MPIRNTIVTLLFCCVYSLLFSQSLQSDSLMNRYDSLYGNKHGSDDRTTRVIDSVQLRVNKLFNPSINQLSFDQGKRRFNKRKERKDSLDFYTNLQTNKIQLKWKIDSLQKAGLSSQKYDLELDSINKLKYTRSSGRRHANTILERKRIVEKGHTLSEQEIGSLSQSGWKEIGDKKRHRDSIEFYKKLQLKKSIVKARIDSLQAEGQSATLFQQQYDSLDKMVYHPQSTQSLQSTMDSLSLLSPAEKLDQSKQKLDNLGDKAIAPVKHVEDGINDKLSLMNNESGGKSNLPTRVSSSLTSTSSKEIGDVSLPATSLPSRKEMAVSNPLSEQLEKSISVKEKILATKELPGNKFAKVGSSDELISAENKLSDANRLTDQAQLYQQEMGKIAKGDVDELKVLPQEAEKEVGKLGLDEFQKETGQFDQYSQIANQAKDQNTLKKEAIKQLPQMAIDHFAGKGAVIQQAMEKMSKLKSVYNELPGIDGKLKRINTIRGKPLIERLHPELNLQSQRTGKSMVIDYNPGIGYSFFERFSVGIGWNERFSVNSDLAFSLKNRIYGPRTFVNFKLGRGFVAHFDMEKMNTYVPSFNNGAITDFENRAWVGSAFIGLKKEYKFLKNVRGSTQFLYNLWDDHDNSPYRDRICVRIGFELSMRTEKKKKTI